MCVQSGNTADTLYAAGQLCDVQNDKSCLHRNVLPVFDMCLLQLRTEWKADCHAVQLPSHNCCQKACEMSAAQWRLLTPVCCRLCERQTPSGGLCGRPEKLQDVSMCSIHDRVLYLPANQDAVHCGLHHNVWPGCWCMHIEQYTLAEGLDCGMMFKCRCATLGGVFQRCLYSAGCTGLIKMP